MDFEWVIPREKTVVSNNVPSIQVHMILRRKIETEDGIGKAVSLIRNVLE